MTNKRNLKKTINNICDDLFAECIAASLYNNKKDSDIDPILTSIIQINSDFIRRISHPEPGMAQKDYYKRLISDFEKSANEIVDQICNLG
ncbi:MAG: hypothetical protein IKZ61_01285 [Prevotella sp.]|nr:hypothetical protein [Prevotella sp.]